MSTVIIIIVCVLLLLAYLFDLSSPLTRIPSVILLLIMGLGLRQVIDFLEVPVSDFDPLLQILGTLGLILIVLEGSLDLDLNKDKGRVIWKSVFVAIVPMLLLALGLALAFTYLADADFRTSLLNAIPFCVISSAIAIPSVSNLKGTHREFVIYESSLSDVFGILFFNFIALNEIFDWLAFGTFVFQLIVMVLVSAVSVLGLSFLLGRNKHHINYAPVILLVILIYAVSKELHLPGLIFIVVFGLFLGNFMKLKHLKWLKIFQPEKLEGEVVKFKEINVEATFLIRALFFLLFGFLMSIDEILNLQTFPWAVLIVLAILLIRWAALKVIKLPTTPLLFIAPRGLITILLFITILPSESIDVANKSLIIQTIIISALVMMVGLMTVKNDKALQMSAKNENVFGEIPKNTKKDQP